jgi:hypothetical protein
MHGVCGPLGIFAKNVLLMLGYFVKHFIFKVHPLPKEQEVFHDRTKSPRLNHPVIMVVSHRFLFSKIASGLPIHHSSRLYRRTF